jgi:hypothetical protein
VSTHSLSENGALVEAATELMCGRGIVFYRDTSRELAVVILQLVEAHLDAGPPRPAPWPGKEERKATVAEEKLEPGRRYVVHFPDSNIGGSFTAAFRGYVSDKDAARRVHPTHAGAVAAADGRDWTVETLWDNGVRLAGSCWHFPAEG